MARTNDKAAGDTQEAERQETQEAPTRDYAQEAKVLSNTEARQEAGEGVLAEQLKQQAESDQGPDVIVDEQRQATRAAHQSEGGGAWPPELLARGTTPVAAPINSLSPEQRYTSHES